MICIWSSWCYCHPIISCSSKIRNGLHFWCQFVVVVVAAAAAVVVVFCAVVHYFWSMKVCFCSVWFRFHVPSQDKHLRNEWPILCRVGRKTLTLSINFHYPTSIVKALKDTQSIDTHQPHLFLTYREKGCCPFDISALFARYCLYYLFGWESTVWSPVDHNVIVDFVLLSLVALFSCSGEFCIFCFTTGGMYSYCPSEFLACFRLVQGVYPQRAADY